MVKDLERLVGKLRHAAIGITEGRSLMGPINIFLAIKPKRIFWDRYPAVRRALQDWAALIREAAAEPTHVEELVPGSASYKGTLDAAGAWGVGGVWVPGTKDLAPIVGRVRWPNEVLDRLVTKDNPDGDITNSDLEMAAEVLGFIVLEANVSLRWEHVGVCSDNSATVAWQGRVRPSGRGLLTGSCVFWQYARV